MSNSLRDLFEEIDRLQEQINRHRPLDEHMRNQIKEYFRIGLTFSSNAIEGNSLTETETKIVLEDWITIGGKPLRDHFEAVGHSQAYDHLYTLAGVKTITDADIKELHRLFYLRIDPENAGVYRKVDVIITGSKYNPPLPRELSKK
jgi:Fic family protein